jgi:hypothetical protein
MKINQLLIKMTKEKKSIFRMHKASIIMIVAAIIVVASIFLSPVFSQSNSPCSSCHRGYNQYLDILEGNAANQLPSTLIVGQTATVSVVVENNVNTPLYTALSSVSLSLASQSGHFSVSVPTYNAGTLQKGTTTATWQITGFSAGLDSFIISASARNSHQNLAFQDSYSPSPTINVIDPTPIPTPTLSPTPPPTPAPTTSPSPTSTPSPTPGPTASPTPTPTQNPTPIPTPTTTPSPTPSPTNSPTPSPIPSPTPPIVPTPIPTSTPTPIPSQSPTNTQIPTVTPTPQVYPTPTTSPVPFPTLNPNSPETPTATPIVTPTTSTIIETNMTQTSSLTAAPTTTPQPTLTPTQPPTSTPSPKQTNDPTSQISQAPTLRVWFRHPSIDEKWVSGSTKIIEWGTTYGSNNMVAKLEFSKTGTTGEWITLAENLTNTNYYIWKVPSQDQNANYFICVTVVDVSKPQETSSDITPLRITQTVDSQLMIGLLLVPGIAVFIFAVARKQVIQILNNKTLRMIKAQASKYPTLFQNLRKIEDLISTFQFNKEGERND